MKRWQRFELLFSSRMQFDCNSLQMVSETLVRTGAKEVLVQMT